jgi:hypothetical protein
VVNRHRIGRDQSDPPRAQGAHRAANRLRRGDRSDAGGGACRARHGHRRFDRPSFVAGKNQPE